MEETEKQFRVQAAEFKEQIASLEASFKEARNSKPVFILLKSMS